MAANTKVKVEGASQYKKDLANMAQAAKTLAAEMKATTTAFNGTSKAQEKEQAVTAKLNQQIANQQAYIEKLKQAIEAETKASGENSNATLKLKEQLANAETALNKMRNSTDEMGESAEKAQKKTSTFGDVLKANLASKVIVDGAKSIANAMRGIATAAVNFGKTVIGEYTDYEALSKGVTTLFGENAQAVQDYASKAFYAAGMSANDYIETVTSFSAALIKSLKGDTAKAADYADMAITDMADNAATFGSDIATLQSAYAGFAKGTYTLLDNLKLGYGGTRSEMARLIRDANKWNKEQGRNTKYSIKNYADIVAAIHDIQTAQEISGKTAENATTTIKGSIDTLKASYSNWLTELGKSDGDIKKATQNMVKAFGIAVKNIMPVVDELVRNIPAIVDMLRPVFDMLVPYFAEAIVNMVSALSSYLPQIATAFKDVSIMLMPYIIEVVNSLISALGNEETVRAIATLIGDVSKAAFQVSVDTLKGTGQSIYDTISNAVTGFILEKMGAQVGESISDAFGRIVGELTLKVTEWALDTIVTPIGSAVWELKKTGEQLIAGLWQGINDKKGFIIDKIKEFTSDIEKWFKEFFGIHSPSRHTAYMGEMLVAGLAQGISGGTNTINNAWQSATAGIGADATSISGVGNGYSVGGNVVNLYAQQIDEATIDYIYSRINGRMGAFA